MPMRNIRKVIVKRLFFGWMILSLLVSGGVYYLEMRKVDKLVMGLAIEEARVFTAELDRSSVDEAAKLRQKAGEFLKGHFVFLQLYDENLKQVLHEINPQKLELERKLQQLSRSPSFGNISRNFLYDKNMFILVELPLRDAAGTSIGHFRGIYQVDAKTLRNIEMDVVGTLFLVIVVILVTAVMLYPVIISLNRELIALSSDLLRGNIEMMDVLGGAIAERDSDTNSHNYRVTIYAIRLGEAVGLDSVQITHLIAGAFLHDLGKIGIRDNILLKPGALTEEEYEVMRGHVRLGVDIIRKSEWLKGARDVVEYHHEKFDGSGYMKGLKGSAIPLNARIFSIVDVFDALTSRRPYKEPFGFDESMKLLKQDSGKRFDPKLLKLFSKIALKLYREIANAEETALESMLDRLVRQHFVLDVARDRALS